MSSEPIVWCKLCRRILPVDCYARGFPPDAARRKLVKLCRASGCDCEPAYLAGGAVELVAYVRSLGSADTIHPAQ